MDKRKIINLLHYIPIKEEGAKSFHLFFRRNKFPSSILNDVNKIKEEIICGSPSDNKYKIYDLLKKIERDTLYLIDGQFSKSNIASHVRGIEEVLLNDEDF